MGNIIIRAVNADDANAILDIYAPYVEKTAITFEYDVPEIEEFRNRIINTLKKYPYIAAEQNGEIIGYAYTGPLNKRAAYEWAAETSIYIKEDKKHMGLGKKLYNVIENISRRQNILSLNACIGYPENDDEHLTKNSVMFHEHMGYSMIGKFHKCGYKFGRWYNMVWMEKMIGEHISVPEKVIKFPDLKREELIQAGLTF